jgi:hypothetical protein
MSADFPVLTALLSSAGLKLVDVGGRGSPFPPFMILAPLADLFVVEPDRVEADRLEQQLPGQTAVAWRSVTVLREAIAAQRGEAPLFLTTAPGMSSLLEPDPAVTGRYYLRRKFDVVQAVSYVSREVGSKARRRGIHDDVLSVSYADRRQLE